MRLRSPRARWSLVPLLLVELLRMQAQDPMETIPGSPSAALYRQAVEAMLARDFSSPRIEYLVLDLRSGQAIATHWKDAGKPIPVGSLLKPFVALAYARMRSAEAVSSAQVRPEFPVVRCHGKGDGCWRAGGHGSLGLELALAESCNAYFLSLAKELAVSKESAGANDKSGLEAIHEVSASYGMPLPAMPEMGTNSQEEWPRMLIGATADWRVAPAALAHAYAELAGKEHTGDEAVDRLLAGMRLAAGTHGTAAKVGVHPGGVLAKTGTAPCVPGPERCVASGDGLVVVLTPAVDPALLLMVRQRGTTGAQTAEVAGRMLTRIEAENGLAWDGRTADGR